MNNTENERTLVLINGNPKDQVVFIEALSTVAPGAQFLMANNSVEALEIMVEDNIVPDCIIVELTMRGISGTDFLREARKLPSLRHVPVIVHAPEPIPHRVSQLKRMGAFAIYFKPYNYWGVCNILNLYMQENIFKLSLN